MQVEKKPYQWVAWLGTAFLLISAGFAAFNIYPLYVYCFLFSNLHWMVIGYIWKEYSLVVLNGGLAGIYLIGLLL